MPALLRRIGFGALFLLGILSIIATGSSSDGPQLAPPPPPEPISPAGIYVGSFTSSATGFHSVSGMISEDLFDSQFFGSDRHYAGTLTSDGDKLTGTLTQYVGQQARFFGIDGVRSITLNGSIDATGLFGDYTGAEDEGRFNLNYLALYERPSSLELTEGVWSLTLAAAGGTVYTVSLSIDATGEIFGTDTPGCVFSGRMSILDNDRNLYEVAMNIELCDALSGEYSGLAYLNDFQSGENNVLALSVSNESLAFSATLYK